MCVRADVHRGPCRNGPWLQERTAEDEFRNLQALAAALQTGNMGPGAGRVIGGAPAVGPQHPDVYLASQLDALESQLDAFEKRFASADPEVKRMLAHFITDPASATQAATADTDGCHATPQSSDSAQTQSGAQGDHRWDCSSPIPALHPAARASVGHQGASHAVQPSPVHQRLPRTMEVGIESSPMFPALTPSNSLAQQVTSRDALADCAASMPMAISSLVRPPCIHCPLSPECSVPASSHPGCVCVPCRGCMLMIEAEVCVRGLSELFQQDRDAVCTTR
jgi:hypothetical protein